MLGHQQLHSSIRLTYCQFNRGLACSSGCPERGGKGQSPWRCRRLHQMNRDVTGSPTTSIQKGAASRASCPKRIQRTTGSRSSCPYKPTADRALTAIIRTLPPSPSGLERRTSFHVRNATTRDGPAKKAMAKREPAKAAATAGMFPSRMMTRSPWRCPMLPQLCC